MKRIQLVAAAALTMAALTLSACGSDQASSSSNDPSKYTGLLKKIAETGEINVITTNSPPFSYVTATDKTVQGISRDIFDGFMKSQGLKGIKINTRVLPFEDSIPAIQAGKADMILDPFYDKPERREIVDFTAPVALIPEGLVVETGNPKDIHSLADLCGRNVGVQAGAGTTDVVKAASAKCGGGKKIGIRPYKIYQSAVSDVALSRLDAAVYDAGVVAYAISQNADVKYELVDDYKPAIPGVCGFIFPKGVEGILPQFDAYLKKIQSDGTEAAILEKYKMLPTSSFIPTA